MNSLELSTFKKGCKEAIRVVRIASQFAEIERDFSIVVGFIKSQKIKGDKLDLRTTRGSINWYTIGYYNAMRCLYTTVLLVNMVENYNIFNKLLNEYELEVINLRLSDFNSEV